MSKNVAIVTGAGSGIGAASAKALVAAGFNVVLAGRRKDRLAEVTKDITRDSGEEDAAHAIPSDIADEASVAALFEETVRVYGRVDVLFNNAGGGTPPVPFESLELKDWQRVVDVNLTGAFLCTREAFRYMKAQTPMGGRIINNGSISAHVPRPNSVAYTATKHAMTGLTRSTSLDGRAHNIVCGQIDIGNALTEMTARMSGGVPQADGTLKAEPTMDVGHVANAVVQMATLPLSANVQFMTIMASTMPFIGRG